MNLATGIKTKLKISPCTVSGDQVTVSGDTPFEAMINPAGYSHSSAIVYTETKTSGASGQEKKYTRTEPEKLEFKQLVLDGTGVVDGATATVRAQIALLRKVAYTFSGDQHQAPIVQVSWGPLLFNGRLESLRVEYTLFKPSGEPLRAKLDLKFTSFKTNQEIFRAADLQSPDLTHLVEVRAGDTLPLLCQRIYKDSSYYLAVARFNGLRQFRALQPGQVLRFPPLV
ncbi:CIS tube protein [Cellvibrio japonicus]|uniref:Contractile injection system tube protein N-terminal domain-containing protein n=1 Tax=Cellvibrio japonicus (strain Ueda107) TaxID=498211 RepID=B3PHT2_CELJU|nr:hypothetical protein [Cellvibrio japonicus]ACE86102.1 conserved hypothetical protein [Cellvibrio japonicus Ueda107]QEI13874.1 peptidoglycan-binding protein [Cellvibrio japonicus]QEI17448.1 peptidoglycan-binding protein [Cellvibrio japonicus]QEI21024.1 peptidoglycan-binding protein [Cellvibrio japonicus]